MRKIDVHAHYGKWPFAGRDASIDDFDRAVEEYETDAFFISSSSAIMYDFVEGNRELFDAISGRSSLYGYVVINSNYPRESMEEIRKYEQHPGFIGVKYHPDYCRKPADSEELYKLYAYMEAQEIPMLIHTFGDGLSSPMKLVSVNKAFPGLKIAAAHMGGDRYDLGILLAQNTNDSIVLEICATYTVRDKIRLAVDGAGIGRVMYGTDYSLFDPSYTIGAVESSVLSEKEKECIYRLNAQRFFSRYQGK